MAAVADARGLKRICAGCGTRFYDMNKRPIICPSCDTEFTGEIKVKARRGRTAAAVEDVKAAEAKAAPKTANDDEVEDDVEEVEVVSLDDAEAEEDKGDDDADDVADADLDLDLVEDNNDDDDDEDDLSDLKGDVDITSKPEKE